MKKSTYVLAAAATVFLLTACSKGRPDPLPFNEFMGHVVQRNAIQLWAWTAVEIDASGETSGKPKNESEWEDAESDALTLLQLTDILDTSAYRRNDERWDQHLAGLRVAVKSAADAALKRDYDALDQANNNINENCVACHVAFAPHLEAPPLPAT